MIKNNIYIRIYATRITLIDYSSYFQGDEGGILEMTIYKTWLDVFKEPIWTMRDFADQIEWESGQVSILQSGHSEYQVCIPSNSRTLLIYIDYLFISNPINFV